MDIVESINRYLVGAPANKGERTRLTRARDEIVRLRTAQRTWIGLTDEEKRSLFASEEYSGWLDYINAIEAKLRKKNQ